MWTTKGCTGSLTLVRRGIPRCRFASTKVFAGSAQSAAHAATPSASQHGPPKPALKGSRPAAPPIRASRRPPPTPRSQPYPHNVPPTPPPTGLAPPQSQSHPVNVQANILLGHQERLCLYKAPVQGGLFLSSYFFGGILYVYAGNILNMTLVNSSGSLLVAGFFGTACLAIATMATAILITPFRLVKRIDLIRGVKGEPLLELWARRALPFMGEKKFTAPPEDVVVNKSVVGTSVSWTSWRMSEARAWTYGNNNVRQKLSFTGVQRAVAKMFWREGMVYLRVGGANWKVDLVRAFMLEDGRPLMKVVTVDSDARNSLWDMAAMALAARKKP